MKRCRHVRKYYMFQSHTVCKIYVTVYAKIGHMQEKFILRYMYVHLSQLHHIFHIKLMSFKYLLAISVSLIFCIYMLAVLLLDPTGSYGNTNSMHTNYLKHHFLSKHPFQ